MHTPLYINWGSTDLLYWYLSQKPVFKNAWISMVMYHVYLHINIYVFLHLERYGTFLGNKSKGYRFFLCPQSMSFRSEYEDCELMRTSACYPELWFLKCVSFAPLYFLSLQFIWNFVEYVQSFMVNQGCVSDSAENPAKYQQRSAMQTPRGREASKRGFQSDLGRDQPLNLGFLSMFRT